MRPGHEAPDDWPLAAPVLVRIVPAAGERSVAAGRPQAPWVEREAEAHLQVADCERASGVRGLWAAGSANTALAGRRAVRSQRPACLSWWRAVCPMCKPGGDRRWRAPLRLAPPHLATADRSLQPRTAAGSVCPRGAGVRACEEMHRARSGAAKGPGARRVAQSALACGQAAQRRSGSLDAPALRVDPRSVPARSCSACPGIQPRPRSAP